MTEVPFCSLLSVLRLPPSPVRLSWWPGTHHALGETAALSYLSGGGQRSWEDVACVGSNWAWLSEALNDRVSPLLVHG